MKSNIEIERKFFNSRALASSCSISKSRSRLITCRLSAETSRHEAANWLVEAGLGDKEVSAISGYKSMQMLKRYTHLRTKDLFAKLEVAFGKLCASVVFLSTKTKETQ
ncbi:MAG: tyrosine-type recombinase/integrase [Gallionellaceae bacterium]|jgi:site-specific recombinase XerD|nr:tyrosine-type recombinase/integrase [Gallionellaceae bacterium]